MKSVLSSILEQSDLLKDLVHCFANVDSMRSKVSDAGGILDVGCDTRRPLKIVFCSRPSISYRKIQLNRRPCFDRKREITVPNVLTHFLIGPSGQFERVHVLSRGSIIKGLDVVIEQQQGPFNATQELVTLGVLPVKLSLDGPLRDKSRRSDGDHRKQRLSPRCGGSIEPAVISVMGDPGNSAHGANDDACKSDLLLADDFHRCSYLTAKVTFA